MNNTELIIHLHMTSQIIKNQMSSQQHTNITHQHSLNSFNILVEDTHIVNFSYFVTHVQCAYKQLKNFNLKIHLTCLQKTTKF